MRVYYGIDRLNKIMKKPCFSVIFLNEASGDFQKYENKVKQRMDVFYERKQTAEEFEDAQYSNRIFTVYKSYIFEKPYNGDLEFICMNNFYADENHVNTKERLVIKEKLRQSLIKAYPQLNKPTGQQKLIFKNFPLVVSGQ